MKFRSPLIALTVFTLGLSASGNVSAQYRTYSSPEAQPVSNTSDNARPQTQTATGSSLFGAFRKPKQVAAAPQPPQQGTPQQAPNDNRPPAEVAETYVPEVVPPGEMPSTNAAATVPAATAIPGSLRNPNRRINFPRDAQDDLDVLKLQIFLDYHGYSPGEIDGRWGYNTERALYMYQEVNGLTASGQLDDAVLSRLDQFKDGYLGEYIVTTDDVDGPFGYVPRDYYAMAKLKWLPYENVLELLGEKFHCARVLLQKLNPGVDFENLAAGTPILVPNVNAGIDEQRGDVSVVRISKHNRWAQAFDAQGRFMFYYPSTLGSEYDPLPLGTWSVTNIGWNPPFKYQPDLFWDDDPNKPHAMLPPGPNSPVGSVWIGTSRKSVGIHGTPNPENISRNFSHGCIRLTNWDAAQLAKRVKPGTRLEFVE